MGLLINSSIYAPVCMFWYAVMPSYYKIKASSNTLKFFNRTDCISSNEYIIS